MISKHMMRGKCSSHLQKQPTFLPMLCSSSVTKGVVVPPHRRRSSSSTEEPSSPRVGCMGQVKRTNKVVAFPSTLLLFKQSDQSCTNLHKSSSIVKYHKLKRFFSAKSLTGSPTATRATTAGTHKTRISSGKNGTVNNNRVRSETGPGTVDHYQHGRMSVCRSKKMDSEKSSTDKGSLVNLEELDPPLPVVKRPAPLQKQPGEHGNNKEDNTSLWKRRAGGAPLKTLQVQVIRPNYTTLPADTS